MPTAAVIPAPIAYIKVVAVKKLVVGFLPKTVGPPLRVSIWMALGIFAEDCICTETHNKSLHQMEELKRVQELRIDDFREED